MTDMSSLTKVEKCQWFDIYGEKTKVYTHDCTTILYSPVKNATQQEVEAVNEIMKLVADQSDLSFKPAKWNSKHIPETVKDADIVGVSSTAQMSAFYVAHPGRAAGLVRFKTPVFETKLPILIDISYNTSNIGNNNYPQAQGVQNILKKGNKIFIKWNLFQYVKFQNNYE